jgi:hypothetical protein
MVIMSAVKSFDIKALKITINLSRSGVGILTQLTGWKPNTEIHSNISAVKKTYRP